MVVLAIFMKHLICTPRFLEKIHKYREEKEITPFPLIQSIGTWLREDEPSEKYNVDWWSFILKHIFITVFNQSKTKTLLYFGNKEKVFKRLVKASEQLVPTMSMFFQWYLLALFLNYLANWENSCSSVFCSALRQPLKISSKKISTVSQYTYF